jgi:raffinose/stachyose/melibiose transport system substrate-binding protein
MPYVRLIALVSAVALVVGACSSSAPTQAPAPSASATPAAATATAAPTAPPTPKPGVTLTAWTLQSDPAVLQELYDQFAAETGHKITVVKLPSDGFEGALTTKWAAGERPDMMEWHGGETSLLSFNPTENLQDLSDEAFVARSGNFSKLNTSYGGKVYGLLMGHPAAFGLYYRKDIFERLGLTPPSTSDELLKSCADIRAKDPSINPIEEGAGSGWPPFVMVAAYMGGQLKNGWVDKLAARTVKLDDADSPVLGSLRFYRQAVAAKCFNKDYLSAQYEDTYKALATGKAAMVSQHSGILIDIRAAFGDKVIQDNIGFAAWSAQGPVVTEQADPSGTWYLPKTGDPAREAAAREFIRFMSGPAYVKYINATKQFPTLDGVPVPADVPPVLKQVADAEKLSGTIGSWTDYIGVDASPLNDVVAGTTTPEEAAKKMQISAALGAKAAGLKEWP